MRYLIFGSEGQLGRVFINYVQSKGEYAAGYDIDRLDISDKHSLGKVFDKEKPDVVINCAAYNLVDKAETERKRAFEVNADAVAFIANECKAKEAFLIHFSTDYVYDGCKRSIYTEEDIPRPINVYGESKLEGEKRIISILKNYLIFRLSWVYGKGEQNFVSKLISWASNKQSLEIADDEISVPSYTGTIVWASMLGLSNGLNGLYHLVNTGYCSRYDWAKMISEELGLGNEIIAVSKEKFKLAARRPSFSAMSNKKLSNDLGILLPNWEMDLKFFLFSLKGERG